MNYMLNMRRQDLIELYQLTTMYKATYQEDTIQSLDDFLERIGELYREATAGKDITRQSNPRKAGRKPKYTAEQDRQIFGLYQTGASLRNIAKEIGCSVGHVQNIIQREKNA